VRALIKNHFKKYKYVLVFLPIIILLIIITAFFLYVNNYYKAMPEVQGYLSRSDKIDFKDSPWIEYTAVNKDVAEGLIIYPGGKVDPSAYAPLAKKVAEAGYKTVVVPMPFNLAVFAPNKAEKVIAENPRIKKWYIAGHSLGGVMGASFASEHQTEISGVILLASYPQQSKDLSSSSVKVISIYGTKDGLVGQDKINSSKKLLPKDTIWLPIKGGNHSQMGWYGFQEGDNKADITREDQQNIVAGAIINFMNKK
jgi:hypothetical protein